MIHRFSWVLARAPIYAWPMSHLLELPLELLHKIGSEARTLESLTEFTN